jgi:hypothetical protein
MSYSETRIDNKLVAQKNILLDRLNDAANNEGMGTLAELSLVLDRLLFVAPVWLECNYQYKTREIAERVRRLATSLQSISRSPKVRGECTAIREVCDKLIYG